MNASVQVPVRQATEPPRRRMAWIGHDRDKVNRSVDPAHTRLQIDLMEVLSQWARIQAEPWIVRINEWYLCREAGCVTRLFPDIMIHMDHVLCPIDQEGYDEEKCGPPPGLLVEVLAPATQLRDRYLKYEVYEAHGVQEYWILDARHQFTFMGDRPVKAWSLEAGRYVPLPLQAQGQEWRMESPFLGTQVMFIQAGAWNWWSLQVQDLQAKTWLVTNDRQIAAKDRQLAAIDRQIAAIDREIETKDQQLATIDQQIETKDQQLAAIDQQIETKDQQLAAIDRQIETKDQQIVQLKAALRAQGIDPDAL